MIRVFVGTGPRWAAHEPVLRYSIERNARAPVEVTFVDPKRHGMENAGCTGFSHVRWAVPELAGGDFAIYLDIDMLVLGDIAALWAYRRPGKYVCLADGATEVMVMDCTRRMYPKDTLHQYGKTHLQHRARAWLQPDIPLHWNVEDTLTTEARLIHFTDLSRQPWDTPERDDAATRVLAQYQAAAA